MILYLTFNDEETFLGVVKDRDELNERLYEDVKNETLYLKDSFWFEGSDSEISDLLTFIKREYKDFFIENSIEFIFERKVFSDMLNYILSNIKNSTFDLVINNDIESLFYKNDLFLFVYLEFLDQSAPLFMKTDTFKLRDMNIDKNNSIIISFINNDDRDIFFESFKIDTKHKMHDKNRGELLDKDLTIYQKLLEAKINSHSSFRDISVLDVLNNTIISLFDNKSLLTSSEVCSFLRINRQTLSNWRKNKTIDYIKISERKYLYKLSDVKKLKFLLQQQKSFQVENITSVSHSVKQNKEDNSQIDTLNKIKDWCRLYSYSVNEKKLGTHFYFLNFGNKHLKSSPQVMINNEGLLIDFIKQTNITNSSEDTLLYLNKLDSLNTKPNIETSKNIYKGFEDLYLNNLYKPLR